MHQDREKTHQPCEWSVPSDENSVIGWLLSRNIFSASSIGEKAGAMRLHSLNSEILQTLIEVSPTKSLLEQSHKQAKKNVRFVSLERATVRSPSASQKLMESEAQGAQGW